ncbi:MAG: NAD(P)/FAD-dependent oxidoreductase [Methylohalobius crimeensis]
MNFHRESRRERYDAVVIGAGIGGLTAGALLARAGRSVLVVERHDRPGGYLHGFCRRGYRFDAGVHSVGGCAETGPFHRRALGMLVECLGLRERVRFLPVDPVARVCFPDLEIAIPQGLETLQANLTEAFPNEYRNLTAFLTLAEELADEAARAAAGLPGRWRWLPRYRHATLAEVLAEYLDDSRLQAVLGALWPYMGLPPGQLSFLYWALMFIGYVADGAGYCQGSFQRLADGLAETIETAGGEMLYRIGVRSIALEDGRAAGVITDNGQKIRAPVVISNADLLQTFQHLLPADRVPGRYLSRLRGLQPSTSVFVVYAAAKSKRIDPGWHESFHYAHFDHRRHFRATCAGDPDWLSITVPTHTDASLAPEGTHLLMLTTLAPYALRGSWRTHKDVYRNRLLEMAERRLPGLQANLLLTEAGTPRTMERYTLNHHGAAYGWAPTPRQIGPGRPAVRTPLEGLYLAGHWSTPGGGVYGAALSGISAAQVVLGLPDQASLWEWLGSRTG